MDNPNLEFYLNNHSLFLADFWAQGNTDLRIEIDQRSDVESGVWYTAQWKSKHGYRRMAVAQRYKLVWERIIKQYLVDEQIAVSGEQVS